MCSASGRRVAADRGAGTLDVGVVDGQRPFGLVGMLECSNGRACTETASMALTCTLYSRRRWIRRRSKQASKAQNAREGWQIKLHQRVAGATATRRTWQGERAVRGL